MIKSLADLRPGDLGFTSISGPGGALVSIGQSLLAENVTIGRLKVRHVFVVSEVGMWSSSKQDFPRAVEAMPNGARQVRILDRWGPQFAYARLPEDYPGQAQDAAAIARAMIGTPYSFASYAALGLWRAGLKTPKLEAWIDRRRRSQSIQMTDGQGRRTPMSTQMISLPREAICSVLADQAWSLAGHRVMQGVAHQAVTPGAMAAQLIEREGVQWAWPSGQ